MFNFNYKFPGLVHYVYLFLVRTQMANKKRMGLDLRYCSIQLIRRWGLTEASRHQLRSRQTTLHYGHLILIHLVFTGDWLGLWGSLLGQKALLCLPACGRSITFITIILISSYKLISSEHIKSTSSLLQQRPYVTRWSALA